MRDLLIRQSEILKEVVTAYHSGDMGLNSLIQKIEGIQSIIDDLECKESLFRIVLNLEQINAVTIESQRELTQDEVAQIDKELEVLNLWVHQLADL